MLKLSSYVLIFLLGFGIWSLGFGGAYATHYPLTIKDESGHALTISAEPVRIISSMPSNTEILCALGLQDKIVGVTSKCNYPASMLKKEKIGDVIINTEKVLSLKPDLIVMLDNAQKAEVGKLRKYNLPVFVINPRSLAGVISSARLLGFVTNKELASAKLARDIEDRWEAVSKRVDRNLKPKIFVEIWHKPLITAGRGTFIDDIIKLAGGINITVKIKAAYLEYSWEQLLLENPDYILVPFSSSLEFSRFLADRRMKKLKAFKNNHIIFVKNDILLRPGPRLIEALEKIVRFIYGK